MQEQMNDKTNIVKGLDKLKIKKLQNKLDRVQPTHPLSTVFVLETHHWHGQNTGNIIINDI